MHQTGKTFSPFTEGMFFVLQIKQPGITVVESGEEIGMRWGKFISWDELDHCDASKSYSNQRNNVWHYEY